MNKLFLLFCFLLLCPTVFAQDETESALAGLLSAATAISETGVVVYVKYAENEWLVSAGLADMENEIPIEVDDLFRLAHVTQPFVATMVLQLVSEGYFGLDDAIGDYLPSEITENLANADTATIRQVLQMTSGIPDYILTDAYDAAIEENPDHAWTAEDALAFTYGEEARFSPGNRYSRSNSNYLLAQVLIETSTGNSLADEIQNRIFVPLGMESCYLETYDVLGEGIVRGYARDELELIDVTEINDFPGLGDRGAVCNARDLSLFLPALMNGELLDETMLAEMFTVLDSGEGTGYGLGIYNADIGYGDAVVHQGVAAGFHSLMSYQPDSDLVLIALTNNVDDSLAFGFMVVGIMNIVLDE